MPTEQGLVELLGRALYRMKLINGDDSNCRSNPVFCDNHRLIHEIESVLTGKKYE